MTGTGPLRRPPRIVALGGGHGLAASLAAAREITPAVTAVVTVADDGGSSGRLRRELAVLPPGDLRMALHALVPDGRHDMWTDLLQYRFPGDGPLGGHALGNLVLAALSDRLGDPVAALDAMVERLGAAGRVLPASPVPLEAVATVAGLDPADPARTVEVRGQASVAVTPGRVVRLRLEPADPPACRQAVAAVRDADLVVLGPGSWYTSVITHLLVPELAAALRETAARRAVVLNLAAQPGETSGFSPGRHLQVLAQYAPGLRLDAVLADPAYVVDRTGLADLAARSGARLVLARVGVAGGAPRHDPHLLAAVLHDLLPATSAAAADPGGAGWR